MQSSATTVQQYLDELPEDRRLAIETIRETILNNLPKGYEETMRWGMISYEVPFSIKPDTYNKQPLSYAAIASQKNHIAIYLSSVYSSEDRKQAFESAYEKSGKKLDMGKSCVRAKKLEDIPLDVIGECIASIPVEAFVSEYEALHKG